MTLAWIVTPLSQPDKKIAGPFRDYEEARRKCVQLVSHEGKLDAALNSRVPNCYVPRAIKIANNTRESHPVRVTRSQHASHDLPANQSRLASQADDVAQKKLTLPERFHLLKRGQLLHIAVECGIDVGNARTRAELIAAIRKGLEE